MNGDWLLRRAADADLGGIMALETSIFTTDAWSPATMRTELNSRHGYYLVVCAAEAPERIDGYAGLLSPRGAHEADIQTIAVAEAARRHGLGHTLIAAMLAEAERRGAREVFLEVRADNPGAQELYRRFGFEQIGVRKGYYQPDGVDAYVMRGGAQGIAQRSATPAPSEPANDGRLGSKQAPTEIRNPS